jgi:hypothetical protein
LQLRGGGRRKAGGMPIRAKISRESAVASSLDDASEGLIDCPHVPGHEILPVLVIYGASASGKTAVVQALRWMRSAVLLSHSRGEPGGGIQRTPFALDPPATASPARYEMDFVVESVRYHYGFAATVRAFSSEWLFAFPNDRRQALFERQDMQFRSGRNLRGRNHVISELTRPNSLFLSAAPQNGHDELTKIIKFFQSITIGEVQRGDLAKSLRERALDEGMAGRDGGTGALIEPRNMDWQVKRACPVRSTSLNSAYPSRVRLSRLVQKF